MNIKTKVASWERSNWWCDYSCKGRADGFRGGQEGLKYVLNSAAPNVGDCGEWNKLEMYQIGH